MIRLCITFFKDCVATLGAGWRIPGDFCHGRGVFGGAVQDGHVGARSPALLKHFESRFNIA
jgi:hypothetical protein